MKPPIGLSFFRSLILPIFFILPYIFLSSCGDTLTPVVNTNENIKMTDSSVSDSSLGDNSIECTKGMLKVLITFNDNTTFFSYAILTQATGTDIFVLDNNFSFISKPMLNVRTIAVTKWRTPRTFWSRSTRYSTVTDSLLCNSVRYSGASGSWYMEGTTDTIVKPPNTFTVLNCTEKY